MSEEFKIRDRVILNRRLFVPPFSLRGFPDWIHPLLSALLDKTIGIIESIEPSTESNIQGEPICVAKFECNTFADSPTSFKANTGPYLRHYCFVFDHAEPIPKIYNHTKVATLLRKSLVFNNIQGDINAEDEKQA